MPQATGKPEVGLPPEVSARLWEFADTHEEVVAETGWRGWLGHKRSVRPSAEERRYWTREVIGRAVIYLTGRTDATDDGLFEHLVSTIKPKAGPLTWLWVLSLIIQLVRLWRDWKEANK